MDKKNENIYQIVFRKGGDVFLHGNMCLRKIDREDLGLLACLKSDSWLGTHQVTIANDEDQDRWFKSLCHNVNSPKNLVLIATMNNAKVGIFKIFGADYINRTADVGWDVFEDFRGKGLGKQLVIAGCAFCFDILALRRLTAEILANNIASLKCAKFAGFTIEGTKRQAVHRLGEYIDSLVLGMLISDKNLALQSKVSPL